MINHSDRFEFLYRQYIHKACTREEMQEFFEYVANPAYKEKLDAMADQHLDELPLPEQLPEIDWEYMYRKIRPLGEETNDRQRPGIIRVMTRRSVAAAAIIILLLGAAAWLWLIRTPQKNLANTENNGPLKQDIAPGGNKATLTLANGSAIVLDSAANGALAQQGNAQVLKTANGQLAYNTDNEKPAEVLYNTLVTPRGGQYQLVLPDGSKVWLNAASSIRYPTAFTGKQRGVEITGEAYFEVAKNAAMPFMVKANGMEVNVLGTHFNVNAYDDETVARTTLLEGTVKVTKDAATAILKPGQQAQLSNDAIKVANEVNIDQVMAWKNGLFDFTKADIQTVMRQIARWYDVEVVYTSIPKGTYSGEVSRNTNLSNVLKILEISDVKFRIEGKKIIVSP